MAPDINNAANGTFSTSFARRQSLELMNPPADSPLRKTSFISGTFNLVATVVGGGVLSLPLVFAKAGLVLGTAMMVVAAIITDFSLYIVCCCVRRTGSTSYMDVVRFAFGPTAELFTTAILWVFLSGVLIAYNVLLKGIFGPLARDFVTTFTSIRIDGNFDAFVLFIILLLVSPLTLERNLYALRHICYVGFTSVCVIALSIGVRVYQRNISRNHSEELHLSNTSAGLAGIDMQIKYFTTDWMDALSVFPIIILAFMCTFNVVEVHGVSSKIY
jgi:amino acid permease